MNIEFIMAINARREQLRDQIRKKQRETFFMQERIKHFNHKTHNNNSQQNLVQQLLQKQNIEQNLDAILDIVKSNHCKADAMKLIEKGLIPALVSFLQESVHTRKTLEILSFLIETFTHKPYAFDLCSQLYEFGIFQMLVRLLDLKQGGALSTFVLYCFSQAHQDYCEAIFQGGVYSILMGQLMRMLQSFPYIEVETRTQEYLFCMHILKTLQNLASLKESPLDFTQQKRQIVSLVQFCLERRLFLKVAFGILYEVIQAEQTNIVTEDVVLLINQILSQADPSSNYIQNLFATIYRLTPHPSIEYSLVFKTATKNSKTYKIVSYILQELLKKKQHQMIPTSEIFWEKIVTGSLNDEEIFKRMLRVTAKIDIEHSLFCRIIAVALEDDSSLGVQREALETLESFVKQEDKLEVRLSEINRHKIPHLLNKLSESGNSRIKERAAWLTDYILGPMTDMSSRIQSL